MIQWHAIPPWVKAKKKDLNHFPCFSLWSSSNKCNKESIETSISGRIIQLQHHQSFSLKYLTSLKKQKPAASPKAAASSSRAKEKNPHPPKTYRVDLFWQQQQQVVNTRLSNGAETETMHSSWKSLPPSPRRARCRLRLPLEIDFSRAGSTWSWPCPVSVLTNSNPGSDGNDQQLLMFFYLN